MIPLLTGKAQGAVSHDHAGCFTQIGQDSASRAGLKFNENTGDRGRDDARLHHCRGGTFVVSA
jgi:hypothetical protein